MTESVTINLSGSLFELPRVGNIPAGQVGDEAMDRPEQRLLSDELLISRQIVVSKRPSYKLCLEERLAFEKTIADTFPVRATLNRD